MHIAKMIYCAALDPILVVLAVVIAEIVLGTQYSTMRSKVAENRSICKVRQGVNRQRISHII